MFLRDKFSKSAWIAKINDIGNKITQERQLKGIYSQHLQRMKEMEKLKQQIGINNTALNVKRVPETSLQSKI